MQKHQKQILAAILAAAIVCSIAAIGTFQDAEAKKQKQPKLKDRVTTLEQALVAVQQMFDELDAQIAGLTNQASVQATQLSNALAALTNVQTEIGIIQSQLGNFDAIVGELITQTESNTAAIIELQNAPGGSTYDDSELRAEIAALKAKLKPISFGSQGAQIQGISAPAGQTGKIFLAAVDNGNCVLNSVDVNPGSGDYRQYGWCPQNQIDSFFMPNTNVTSSSVIDITIGNQPVINFVPINCWTGTAANMTLADGQTDEVFVEEGFLVQCSGTTRSGMTMVATITNP